MVVGEECDDVTSVTVAKGTAIFPRSVLYSSPASHSICTVLHCTISKLSNFRCCAGICAATSTAVLHIAWSLKGFVALHLTQHSWLADARHRRRMCPFAGRVGSIRVVLVAWQGFARSKSFLDLGGHCHYASQGPQYATSGLSMTNAQRLARRGSTVL